MTLKETLLPQTICMDVVVMLLNLRVFLRDICPILKDPATLTAVIDLFEEHVRKNYQHVDLIVGKTVVYTLMDALLLINDGKYQVSSGCRPDYQGQQENGQKVST